MANKCFELFLSRGVKPYPHESDGTDLSKQIGGRYIILIGLPTSFFISTIVTVELSPNAVKQA